MSGAYDCNYDFVDDPLSALVEAHAEIRRLENEHAAELDRLRLTDAERGAVERAADWLERWQQTHGYHPEQSGDLATLRGLLERLK